MRENLRARCKHYQITLEGYPIPCCEQTVEIWLDSLEEGRAVRDPLCCYRLWPESKGPVTLRILQPLWIADVRGACAYCNYLPDLATQRLEIERQRGILCDQLAGR